MKTKLALLAVICFISADLLLTAIVADHEGLRHEHISALVAFASIAMELRNWLLGSIPQYHPQNN